jgi:hypothetical protein
MIDAVLRDQVASALVRCGKVLERNEAGNSRRDAAVNALAAMAVVELKKVMQDDVKNRGCYQKACDCLLEAEERLTG